MLIITKIQFLPCLPDLSVMNDKVKGGEKTTNPQTRETNRKRTHFPPCVQLSQIISRPGSLHLCKRDLFLTINHCLGTGDFKERTMHHLNSNAVCKPVRQVYKWISPLAEMESIYISVQMPHPQRGNMFLKFPSSK